ncbi:uncharacterized protein LOC116212207 [Punica granatum]|uniref:DUF3511 domain-containing protein n=2 Tax=Punica granatum TaxID=22663 RepID=A0A218XP80_PUNGR|nr:uncharacterized protein LOC116212207 [Punica granatum]OWM86082.1 hypothetical protein CDL15_Pgr010906 [Punica granatum]PKI50585.1 hypothetical protein CRG98_029025 [Punica granatum]
MDGFGSAERPYGYGGDRRMEIVSGKSAGRPPHYPLDPPPGPTRATWPGQGSGVAAAAAAKPWGFTDPEMKRKKRIARYKAYGVEGRLKASLRRGIRWIKDKCSQIVHGY